jgi:hypothetical protein
VAQEHLLLRGCAFGDESHRDNGGGLYPRLISIICWGNWATLDHIVAGNVHSLIILVLHPSLAAGLHVFWSVVEAIWEHVVSPLTSWAHLFHQLERRQQEVTCSLLKAAWRLQDGGSCSRITYKYLYKGSSCPCT